MGFETTLTHERVNQILIWTLSLWDLKLVVSCSSCSLAFYLNFVPMGFETIFNWEFGCICNIWTLSLWDLKPAFAWKRECGFKFELCPYGIWNYRKNLIVSQEILFELCPYGIWNPTATTVSSNKNASFELCPYGIWNGHTHCPKSLLAHLNFVPMGFETRITIMNNGYKK